MRLTDETLRMSDAFHAELVERALLLSSAGRFGLLPALRPFKVALDFNRNTFVVVSMDCLALTKGGQLLDISFDSTFSGDGSVCLPLPDSVGEEAFLLVVSPTDEWKDTHDGGCEPVYRFGILGENVPLPDDAFPVARIVEDMGWREDDRDFIPPCLFVSSHPAYVSFRDSFVELLGRMDDLVRNRLVTDSGEARRVFWPEVRRLSIVMDKETQTMTPMSFFARVQECVSAFFCACTLDDGLRLSEAERYQDYIRTPYNYKEVFLKIRAGIVLIADICSKLEALPVETERVAEAPQDPFIPSEKQHLAAVTNDVRVEVLGIPAGTTCYYSIDGSAPSTPLEDGRYVCLNPGFNKTRGREQDRHYPIQLQAVKNGEPGNIVKVDVIVSKNIDVWKGFQI